MNTIWAVIRDGKIVPLEEVKVPDGTRVLVTLLPECVCRATRKTSSSSRSEAKRQRYLQVRLLGLFLLSDLQGAALEKEELTMAELSC